MNPHQNNPSGANGELPGAAPNVMAGLDPAIKTEAHGDWSPTRVTASEQPYENKSILRISRIFSTNPGVELPGWPGQARP